MDNAKLLRETCIDLGLKVHGGIDAPYVFVDLEGKSSWDMFSKILEEAQVITPLLPSPRLCPVSKAFEILRERPPRSSLGET